MSHRILIIGAGFAGLWSALSAARLRGILGLTEETLEIIVVAPEPMLTLRPRLYEASPAAMVTPLSDLFEEAGVKFVAGVAEKINHDLGVLTIGTSRKRDQIGFDRLVLAAGSGLTVPPIPGVREHGFSVDNLAEACKLEAHLKALAVADPAAENDTVIIVGGGFTGIEVAADMPSRLREVFGERPRPNVVIVERETDIGPDLGPGPRPVIEQALCELGVELRLGVSIASIDQGEVRLSNGDKIRCRTVVWTGGVAASALTEQFAVPRDQSGRLLVDRHLRVLGYDNVFAAGDVASAEVGDGTHRTMMSCQHAMPMGRVAGNNALADLMGIPLIAFEQTNYVTCLDLGGWGAVLTQGWEREVVMSGVSVKSVKANINRQRIYPPTPAALANLSAVADPAQ